MQELIDELRRESNETEDDCLSVLLADAANAIQRLSGELWDAKQDAYRLMGLRKRDENMTRIACQRTEDCEQRG